MQYCVDRLEVGLKPACSSACLAGALDFGIIETTPGNRHQTETRIPGFPTPRSPIRTSDSSRSTACRVRCAARIRCRSVMSAMRRARVESIVQRSPRMGGRGAGASKGLSTRENPLVVFTLVTQAVVGAFLVLFLGPVFGLRGTDAVETTRWPGRCSCSA